MAPPVSFRVRVLGRFWFRSFTVKTPDRNFTRFQLDWGPLSHSEFLDTPARLFNREAAARESDQRLLLFTKAFRIKYERFNPFRIKYGVYKPFRIKYEGVG